MIYPRDCDCPHGFPICAHGLEGAAKLAQSRRLSAIAGWPGPITDDGLAVAGDEWAAYVPPPELPELEAVRMAPPVLSSSHDCGCGGHAAAAVKMLAPKHDCGCGGSGAKRSSSSTRARIERRRARQAQ